MQREYSTGEKPIEYSLIPTLGRLACGKSLRYRYVRVRPTVGVAGGAGQDLEDGSVSRQVSDFAAEALANLAELRRSLRASEWRPHPVYAMEIPKPSGGKRLIGVPAVEDRVVERAIMEVIDEHVDAALLPWSYAYRRGLSAKDAIHDLTQARDDGARWVVRADIEACFEEIPRWPALQRLREVVPDERITHVVGSLVNRHGIGPAAKRIKSGRGLHQGSPLSPVLTNLYLDAFDRDLLRQGHRVPALQRRHRHPGGQAGRR